MAQLLLKPLAFTYILLEYFHWGLSQASFATCSCVWHVPGCVQEQTSSKNKHHTWFPHWYFHLSKHITFLPFNGSFILKHERLMVSYLVLLNLAYLIIQFFPAVSLKLSFYIPSSVCTSFCHRHFTRQFCHVVIWRRKFFSMSGRSLVCLSIFAASVSMTSGKKLFPLLFVFISCDIIDQLFSFNTKLRLSFENPQSKSYKKNTEWSTTSIKFSDYIEQFIAVK